jgi:hypothetical protein
MMPHRRSSYLMLCPVSLVVVEHRAYEFSFMTSESLFMCSHCSHCSHRKCEILARFECRVRVMPGNYNRHILTNEHILPNEILVIKQWLDINIQDDNCFVSQHQDWTRIKRKRCDDDECCDDPVNCQLRESRMRK